MYNIKNNNLYQTSKRVTDKSTVLHESLCYNSGDKSTSCFMSAAVVTRSELLLYLLGCSGEALRGIAARSTADGLRTDVFICSAAAQYHTYRRALNID